MNVQATSCRQNANHITAINNTTGTAWVTPGYDRAGNMIGIPNPTISSTATYDASLRGLAAEHHRTPLHAAE